MISSLLSAVPMVSFTFLPHGLLEACVSKFELATFVRLCMYIV